MSPTLIKMLHVGNEVVADPTYIDLVSGKVERS